MFRDAATKGPRQHAQARIDSSIEYLHLLVILKTSVDARLQIIPSSIIFWPVYSSSSVAEAMQMDDTTRSMINKNDVEH